MSDGENLLVLIRWSDRRDARPDDVVGVAAVAVWWLW